MAPRGGGNVVEIVVKTKDETGATGQRVKRELIRQGSEGGKGFSRSFGTGLKSGFAGIAGVAKGLGVGLLAAVGGVAALGAGAVVLGPKLASASARLADLDAKAKAVFVDQLPQVRRWAEENKRALGLSSRETVGLAANLADLLKPIGFTAREATNMSLKFLDLAGALSKWSGGTRSAAEVSEILSAAVLGERDQLKELGISISEADVQARLAAKGQKDLTGAALAQAEAVATQELIYAKSTDAQKAWAEGGRQAAVAQKSLSSTISEVKERIVTALTPAVTAVTGWLNAQLPAAIAVAEGKLRDLGSALTTARDWWDRNRNSIQVLVNALSVLFTPAAQKATGETRSLQKAQGDLRQSLSGILEIALRVVQIFLRVAIAAGTTRDWILRLGIGVGLLINAVDRLSGGTGHAADSMVAAFRRMKDEGAAQMRRLQDQIRNLQNEIDGLHGKTIFINTVVRRQTPGGGLGAQYQHGTPSAPGGVALVGEQGPELVELPRGSRVHPNRRTREILGRGELVGAGGNAYTITVHVPVGGNPRDVGAEIVAAIRAYEKGSGKGWRTGPNG